MNIDDSVRIQTISAINFRYIQQTLKNNSIKFHTFSLPEDRVIKVVIRGIHTDIPQDEVMAELVNFGFNVKTVKRFGTATKHMPLCLVIVAKYVKSTEIFSIDNLFCLSVKVETYKRSAPRNASSARDLTTGRITAVTSRVVLNAVTITQLKNVQKQRRNPQRAEIAHHELPRLS